MFLKHLTIEKNGELVRKIDFKLGVNLIVDTTESSDDETESGNNVGKTTVLNLVDYCLGGKEKAIYEDPEFKTQNSAVKSFLKDNNVIITLSLGKSFENSNDDVILKRNFLQRTKKVSTINGDNYSNNTEYCRKLGELLFDYSSAKPSFRQLIPRFIRNDSRKMDRVIKYLHDTTSDNDYEGIYFFLFVGETPVTELSSEKEGN